MKARLLYLTYSLLVVGSVVATAVAALYGRG